MLTVSFLCMRVCQPDVEDLKKIKTTFVFLKQTINNIRVIGVDSLEQIDAFIDSSHQIHPEMRGHTRGAMTMGTGIIHGKASKQKNSKSTNETEVIGDSKCLPYAIWVDYIMDEQGRKIKRHILWQDNDGAEKICKNGNRFCSSNSRDISIKYFWVVDRVKQGKIDIRYCSTAKMLADFYTQPLQG